MPLTDYACPACGGLLHTDDLIDDECVTPGCGATLSDYADTRGDLPEWDGGDGE